MSEYRSQEKSSLLGFARKAFPYILLATGMFTLISGIIILAESKQECYWAYAFQIPVVETHSVFFSSSGANISPQSLSIRLLSGGALLAAGLFVHRRRFSLRLLMVSILAIGLLGMLPGMYSKGPVTRMSVHTVFSKKLPHAGNELERDLNDTAFETLPDEMLQDLNLTMRDLTYVHLRGPTEGEKQGALMMYVELARHLNNVQREALAEFYAFYFERRCFELAKDNGLINEISSTRPYVSGRFYKYQKEWEAKRAAKNAAPTPTR
jgi:hypothetical protein